MYFPVSIEDESSLTKPHPQAEPFEVDGNLCWALDLDLLELLELVEKVGFLTLTAHIDPNLVVILLPRQITE
jgi:hypothetical protein